MSHFQGQGQKYPPLWQHANDRNDLGDDCFSTQNQESFLQPVSFTSHSHESFIRARVQHGIDPLGCVPSSPGRYAFFETRGLWNIVQESLPIGEEVALCSLLFSLHQIQLLDQPRICGESSPWWCQISLVTAISVSLLLVLVYSEDTNVSLAQDTNTQQQTIIGAEGLGVRIRNHTRKRDRIFRRSADALMLAGLLRLLSSVLRTLTASYSSDTVTALAVSGTLVHLLACDYQYANGRNLNGPRGSNTGQVGQRPTFKGGTISLNASFFSTTLLASRLQSDAAAFTFVSFTVIAFAFYPDARHNIARHSAAGTVPLREVVSLALFLGAFLALGSRDRVAFYTVLVVVCLICPFLMWWLQRYRKIITGPWDIAHVDARENEDSDHPRHVNTKQSHGNEGKKMK